MRYIGQPLVSALAIVLAGACASAPAPASVTGVAEVNGVSLPYEVVGSGTPIVLIHGWAVDQSFWDGDVPRLAATHRVIRYDRRGFGRATGKPDPTADAADLRGLLEALGVGRAHLIGHSGGASTALTVAVRYPEMVDRLVLFGPGPLPGQPLPTTDDAPSFADWVAIGQRDGVEALRGAIAGWALDHFGGDTRGLDEPFARMLGTYSGADLLDPAPPANLAPPAGVDDLAAVSAPALVLTGEDDMSFITAVAELEAERIPGARRATIAGAGHVANWQQPDRFAETVLAFVNEPLPARAASATAPREDDPPASTRPPGDPVVVFETEKGTIEFRLYASAAPQSVEHIVSLVDRHFYRGQRFHRAERSLVQIGDPLSRDVSRRDYWGSGGSGTPIGVAEFNSHTHRRGAVGLAHAGTARFADSQIYFMKAASPSLDDKHVVIGQVIAGLDVLDRLEVTDRIIVDTIKGAGGDPR